MTQMEPTSEQMSYKEVESDSDRSVEPLSERLPSGKSEKRENWAELDFSDDDDLSCSKAGGQGHNPKNYAANEDIYDYDSYDPKQLDGMSVLDMTGRKVKASKKFYLQRPYTLWYDAIKKVGNDYSAGLESIYVIETVQSFWRVWNNLASPKLGSLCLFRDDVKPMWEDPGNAKGGRWILNQVQHTKKFEVFTDLCLAMVGGLFQNVMEEFGDCINGIVLSQRKGGNFKIELWNEKAQTESLVKVDACIRSLLDEGVVGDGGVPTSGISSDFKIEYKDHAGSIAFVKKGRKDGKSPEKKSPDDDVVGGGDVDMNEEPVVEKEKPKLKGSLSELWALKKRPSVAEESLHASLIHSGASVGAETDYRVDDEEVDKEEE